MGLVCKWLNRFRASQNDGKPKPNTIVQYQGGGYDGCLWEWNYAYYDKDGKFHNVSCSGYAGCDTEEKLLEILDDDTTDLYELDNPEEVARFGRETPLSHLIGMGKWLVEGGEDVNTDMKLTVVCDECEETVEVVECSGEGSHGVGGIVSEYNGIICQECHTKGCCSYCGEYVGEEDIDGETGYCTGAKHNGQWCKERHGD